MIDLSRPAAEVFLILQSFDYEVLLYDENGSRVEEPTEARRMFARPANLLVIILADGENSTLKITYGKSTSTQSIKGLIETLRSTAVKFNLLFTARRFDGDISPKSFAHETKVEETTEIRHEVETLIEKVIGSLFKTKY